jgi:L-2-hydroxyglutarate oxidase
LQSDRLAALTVHAGDAKIVSFRGEYYRLAPPAERLVRHLIYPVPDPALPFLGVHFTRMIGGGVEAGQPLHLRDDRPVHHRQRVPRVP